MDQGRVKFLTAGLFIFIATWAAATDSIQLSRTPASTEFYQKVVVPPDFRSTPAFTNISAGQGPDGPPMPLLAKSNSNQNFSYFQHWNDDFQTSLNFTYHNLSTNSPTSDPAAIHFKMCFPLGGKLK